MRGSSRITALKQNVFQPDPQKWIFCGLCSVYSLAKRIGYRELKPRDVLGAWCMLGVGASVYREPLSNIDLRRVARKIGLNLSQLVIRGSTLEIKRKLESVLEKSPIILAFNRHAILVFKENQKIFAMDPDDLQRDFSETSIARLAFLIANDGSSALLLYPRYP